ncbi:MAG: ATP-binding protein [Chitinophagales bacterium]
MFFNQVIGHSSLKQQLIHAAQTDKVSQALLFVGAEGVGTLPFALAYAQYLNCESPTDTDSCGTCSSCVKNQKFAHPDLFFTYPTVKAKALSKDYISEWREALVENPYMNLTDWVAKLDNANKQGNITAEECNQIIRQHALRHFEGKYKIQLIWMAETLGKEGNKLLKIIEEPPANTVFILVAESDERILPTILSRTQLIKFSKLKTSDIVANLVEKKGILQAQAEKIAPLAEGNWHLAQELTTDTESDHFEAWQTWLELLFQKATQPSLNTMQSLFAWIDAIGNSGRQNQKIFLKYILFFLRECIALSLNVPTKLSTDEQKLAKRLIEKISVDEMAKMSDNINNLHYQITRNAHPKIGLMATSVELSKTLQRRIAATA